MVIPPSEWEWFGHAGHLAIREWCRFHLCTKVGSFLVSTVGDYVPSHKSSRGDAPSEPIAPGRKYETMAFVASEPCCPPKCGCGMPGLGNDGIELEMLPANTPGEATDNHIVLCEHYAEKEPEAGNG